MASRDAARRGVELLRAMLRLGWLGADPEAVAMIADLIAFVEGETVSLHHHRAECECEVCCRMRGASQPATLAEQRDWLEAEASRLREQLRDEEAAHEATIRQRDFASEWADKLASGVGDVEVIGEHSNLNNPWETAYGLMRSLAEFSATEAEVERLKGCLGRANAQAVQFERDWYLRGDEVEQLRTKVAALEEQVRDAMRGKPAFELLAADLARASGLPACSTWQEHVAACMALRAQVEAEEIRIVPVPESDAA